MYYEVNSSCWTDSTDCIYWINSRNKVWGKFVHHRLKEIRINNPEVSWRFCPGESNPADLPSIGSDIAQSERRDKWLHGPNFLRRTSEY